MTYAAPPPAYQLPDPWQGQGYALTPVEARPRPEARSTAAAVALTLLGPPAMLVASFPVNSALFPNSFNNIGILAPTMGYGFGHLYAGDPGRALMVSLVGPLAILGPGVALGMLDVAIDRSRGTPPHMASKGIGGALLGAAIGYVAYTTWAVVDVMATTRRTNEAALEGQPGVPARPGP